MKKQSSLELIEKRISELTIYIAKRQVEYNRLVKERDRIKNEKLMKPYKVKFLQPVHGTMGFMQYVYHTVSYEDFNKITTGEMPLHLWEVDYWYKNNEGVEEPYFSVYIGELNKIVNDDGSIFYDNTYVSGVPWDVIKEML